MSTRPKIKNLNLLLEDIILLEEELSNLSHGKKILNVFYSLATHPLQNLPMSVIFLFYFVLNSST